MVRRLNVIRLATSILILFCSVSFADTPLVVAELDANRKIAEADENRAAAEHELAAWRLKQLQTLKSRGHASWQEVAEQEVMVRSLAAVAHAAARYHQAILDAQSRSANSGIHPTPKETECLCLYLPQSARLVASMSTDVASPDLSLRHLERLRSEHQSSSDVELSSLKTAIQVALKNADAYSVREQDSHLRERARIRLRLAEADSALAKARKDSAAIIARRMSIVRRSLAKLTSIPEPPSPGIAQLGTRFVDATSAGELSRLVAAMVIDDGKESDQLVWLKHQRDAVSARINALQELSEHSYADPVEIDQANQLKSDLDSRINLAQDAFAVSNSIAGDYKTKFEGERTSNDIDKERLTIDDDLFVDASTVRHWIDLQQLRFQTAASRESIVAQHDYMSERLNRVSGIPEHARPPKELDHLRDQIKGVEHQLTIMDRRLVTLEREQQRFVRQVRSQNDARYQLVQAGDGAFIAREQFEQRAELIAVVGFVGGIDGLRELGPDTPGFYPYLESGTIVDRLSRLSLTGLQPELVSSDLFYCRPLGRWRVKPTERWAPHEYLRPASARGFRTFDPYHRYPFGPCGLSIYSYRIGSPTRSSFPYRSNYLYRTAFPIRGNLYSSPVVRPNSVYTGFSLTRGLAGSCFD